VRFDSGVLKWTHKEGANPLETPRPSVELPEVSPVPNKGDRRDYTVERVDSRGDVAGRLFFLLETSPTEADYDDDHHHLVPSWDAVEEGWDVSVRR
jgi:hypothetical protein